MKNVIALAAGLSAVVSGCGSEAEYRAQAARSDNAIVGGKPATAGQFPGLVSLRGADNKHYCGGSLIAPHWVLTAAHCLDADETGGYKEVVAGNLVISNGGGEHLAVVKAYAHPGYVDATKANDFALLRLKSDAKEPTVKLATASETKALKTKTTFSVAGWGDTVYGSNKGSDKLLYTTLPLVDRKTCAKRWKNLGPEAVCAGAPEGKRDTCQGDSGGPMFATIGGAQKQVALVSYGDESCGKPNMPGVYAGVGFASDWITKTMAEGESDATAGTGGGVGAEDTTPETDLAPGEESPAEEATSPDEEPSEQAPSEEGEESLSEESTEEENTGEENIDEESPDEENLEEENTDEESWAEESATDDSWSEDSASEDEGESFESEQDGEAEL